MRRFTSGPVVAALLCLLSVTTGCKEGDPITGAISPTAASFDEDPVGGVTNHFVTVERGGGSGGTIYLDVTVHEVPESIQAVVMKLNYPAGFSKYISCSAGSFLEPGFLICTESATEAGVVFLERHGNAAPCIGAQTVIRLEFLVYGYDSGAITIEGQNLGGSDGSAVLDEDGVPLDVQWFSGVLTGS